MTNSSVEGDAGSKSTRMADIIQEQTNTHDTVNQTTNVEEIVHRTLAETTRRKRNVVVQGMPDRGNDEADFLTICEENLPIKPVVTGHNKIGKPSTIRPRPLLIKLRSEDDASDLLKAAPLLRHSSDNDVATKVYINADLTPATAKLAYEARLKKRERRKCAHKPPLTDDDNHDATVTVDSVKSDAYIGATTVDATTTTSIVTATVTTTVDAASATSGDAVDDVVVCGMSVPKTQSPFLWK